MAEHTINNQRSVDRAILVHILTGARWMLMLYLGISVIIFIIYTTRSLAYPYPLDYGEGPLLDQAVRISKGENIYLKSIATPPYTVTNYTPLYMLLWGGLTALFGPSYLIGRLVSVLSTLAICFYLYKLTYRFTENRFAAITSAGMFISLPYVLQWTSLARVDLLALALSLAALYVATTTSRNNRTIFTSAILIIASVYTRQSYAFAAPFAVFVYLLFDDWKQAFKLALTVLLLGFAIYGLLTLTTNGGFHFSVFEITVKNNTYDLDTLLRYAKEILDHYLALVLISLGYLILGFHRFPGYKLTAPYLFFSVLTSLTIAKNGSNVNYLLEFCAALSLVTGLVINWDGHFGVKRVADTSSRPHKCWSLVLPIIISIVLGMQVGFNSRFSLAEQVPHRVFRLAEEANMDYLSWQLEQNDSPVISDEYMGLLPLLDRKIYLQNFELTKLSYAGIWDQSSLVNEISTTAFPYIHINRWDTWAGYLTRWTPEMFSALQQSYIATGILGNSIVFEPYSYDKFGARYPDTCPEAPWIAPSDAPLGIHWLNRTMTFHGMGEAGTLPVYAVADGVLIHPDGWNNAIAIRHVDPENDKGYVWSYYSGLSLGANDTLISEVYPTGSGGPVRQGDFIGYQGTWEGETVPVHVSFAILPEVELETFPQYLIDPTVSMPADASDDIHLLNPESYIGISGSQVMGETVWIPMRCANNDE